MDVLKTPEIDKIIFLSDVHIGVKNASIEWLENTKDYFDNVFYKLIDKAKADGNTPAVIVAGDFFDNRQHVDIASLTLGYSIVKEIASRCKIFFVIGNHDIYTKSDNTVTSIKMFSDIDNVIIIYDSAILECKNFKRFLLISWVDDVKTATKIISDNKDTVDIIVMHSEISGMSYDNGRKIINGVNTSIISKHIYSGHIHKRQANERATYLGSPYHLTRSDIGNTKGVYQLDLADDNITESFIPNTYSPIYQKMYYDKIHESPDLYGGLLTNNYVDVVVKRSELKNVTVGNIIEEMSQYSPKKLEIVLEGDEQKVEHQNIEAWSADTNISDMFDEKVGLMDQLDKNDIEKLHNMNEQYLKRAFEEIGNK
jgi:DNA repair exonuclease SbcCD nuclease subunit